MIYVDVQFETGDQPRYTYMSNDESVKPGDQAIVKTRDGKYKIVFIVYINNGFRPKPGIKYTWLVQKIDSTIYDSLVNS